MISKDDMMALMLEACPSFRAEWQEFLAEWEDEAEEPPIYCALGDLARHLASMLARGETESFPAIFAVIERWVVDGDHFVSEAAVVGILEDMQNGNLHTTTTPEQFRQWLGPESERWWDKLYAFWNEGKLLTDD